MAFPPEVQTVTLRMGPVLDVSGNPVAGASLQVSLATQVMILSDGAILPSSVFVRTGADGLAAVTVAATDSTGLDATGFTYRVYATGITTNGAIDVSLPAAAPDVDIEDLAPVQASTGTVWVPPGAFLEAPEPGATGDVLTYGADGEPVWQAPSTAGGPHAATHAAGGTDPVTLTSGQVTGLAPVATSGAYVDITCRPTLGTAAAAATTDFATAAQGATADTAVQPVDLAPVATTGAYTDLTGQPAIPDSPDDIGAAPATHQHAAGDVTSGTLATARLGTGTADNTTFLRGDQTWAAPAGGGGGAALGTSTPVGQYTNGLTFGYNSVQGATIGADVLHAYLMYFPAATPVDEMGLQVLVANAGATLRLGVYADAGGRPGDLLVAHATPLDCSTTGAKSQAVTTTTIPAGTHWGVYQSGGAGAATRTLSPDYLIDISRGAYTVSQAYKRLDAARAAADLPASLSGQAWTPMAGYVHMIVLRRAA